EDNVNNTNNVNTAYNVNTVSLIVNDVGTNEVNVVDGKISIELPFDPKIHALEDVSISNFLSDHEDDGAIADMNNLDTTIQIEEEVYLCQPPGFKDPDFPDRVYKIKKALYRLHQAPRAWYETLSTYLLDNGFQKGEIDKTLFIKRHKGDILMVQVYVDDIIFGSTKKGICLAFEKLMHEKFLMSSIGELTFFLGLQVKQKKDGTFISQYKYVAKILENFGFTEIKTASTPLETQKPLLKDEDGEDVNVHMYRLMIGSLMYITSSRPDIMFAVCAYARNQVNLKVSHLHAVKRIFRGNTFQIDEDSMKLDELLALCTTLQNWVLDLEKTKTTQRNKNDSLKKRVKKLEKRNMSRTYKLKRLYKVVRRFEKVVNIAQVSTAVKTTTITTEEITLAQALKALKTSKPKRKEESFAAKRAEEKRNKPPIKAQQRKIMCTYLKNMEGYKLKDLKLKEFDSIQEMFDKAFKRQKGEDDKEKAELKQLLETILDEEEVAIDAIPLAVKSSRIVDWKIYKEGKKSYYQIVRADRKSQISNLRLVLSPNITKTQSKATPNKPSSQGTDSGGGPRCQESIRDTIDQTRFENVSKHSNDSLLARGNTLQSDEDSIKLNELMKLCTTLQNRVLDLEKIKTTQRNEIDSLKRKVKKLEKSNRSRTHKLKRLYKVGLSVRVESSDNEKSLGEDASKQGRRIDAINDDEDITLVNDADNEMFDVDDLGEITLAQSLEALKTLKSEVKGIVFQEPAALKLQEDFNKKERLAREKAEKEKRANIALIETWDDIQAKIDVDHQLAKKLQAQEQEELSDAEKATLFQQLLEKKRKHFAAKRAEEKRNKHFAAKRAKEKRNKPPAQAQQRKIMCIYLKNMEGYTLKQLKLFDFDRIQEMFDRAFRRVNTFEDFRTETELVEGKEKRAGEVLVQEITKKQKVKDGKEKAELKQLIETILDEEEVAINAIPLVVKSLRIVDWKIHKEGKKSYYQIVRADRKSQMYMIFSQMLKSFDREDLEDLYKLIFQSTILEDLTAKGIASIATSSSSRIVSTGVSAANELQ
nr:putative ribonuclease H-like domain-containing protein [Tanacetum cinerariifolium]